MIETAKTTKYPDLTTGQVAELIGGGVQAETVYKWIYKGVQAPGGRVVRLRALRIGGLWKTTLEWVEAFIEAIQPDGLPPVAETPAEVERRSRKDQEKARKALGGKRRATAR